MRSRGRAAALDLGRSESSGPWVASLLGRLGIGAGDRVATVAWNRVRHLELYFGVTGAGAVLHTVNPRLFSEQIRYIINHAGSRYLFVDPDLLPVVEGLAGSLPQVEGIIVLAAPAEMPAAGNARLLCYDELMSGESEDYQWPQFDENTASILCYTSGTTGSPKGVLYSHRSTVLHAMCIPSNEGMGLSSLDCVLLGTPLFHVNAWVSRSGSLYAAPSWSCPGPLSTAGHSTRSSAMSGARSRSASRRCGSGCWTMSRHTSIPRSASGSP